MIELRGEDGLRACVSPFGASLVSVEAPDRDGAVGNVVLGFDHEDDYRGEHPHFGGTVGRYANRIANGRFALDGTSYTLACNDPPHHLHGGPGGFDRRMWRTERGADGAHPVNEVELRYTSSAGEEGYPGRVEALARYTLQARTLRIDLEARSDAATVVNLTNHAYWNLRDGGSSDVLDHEIWIDADRYTPVDAHGLPTGELASVTDTPFDFREPARLGSRIAALAQGRGGYDHNFVLNSKDQSLRLAARVREPEGGRVLELYTTAPGLQLYSGNFLDGSVLGRNGVRYARHAGLCLEPQQFPDSPNRPGFPSARLEAGELYTHTIELRFECA